jgi:predicted glycoside hydrolase/deacetylase ChbG (UPF0249 family)
MRLHDVLCLLSLMVVATNPVAAQPKTLAERLGHPKDAKLLIIHGDDLGVAHSVNAASFDALDRGAITSASIMMTTPWVTEVAAYARAHPDRDLGLHLVLTSEWKTYRWGPVSSTNDVPSLFDSTGTLPSEVETVVARARPEEVEQELRAQVRRALALGIQPTHLDSHMGALFAKPELFAAYAKVAHEFRLPFLAPRAPAGVSMPGLTERDVVVDSVVQAYPTVAREGWKQYYLDLIKGLRPGLTEMIVHLGHDDAELQAVTVDHEPWGAAWRQRDVDVVNSAEFQQALKDNGVVLVRWRDLQKLTYQP